MNVCVSRVNCVWAMAAVKELDVSCLCRRVEYLEKELGAKQKQTENSTVKKEYDQNSFSSPPVAQSDSSSLPPADQTEDKASSAHASFDMDSAWVVAIGEVVGAQPEEHELGIALIDGKQEVPYWMSLNHAKFEDGRDWGRDRVTDWFNEGDKFKKVILQTNVHKREVSRIKRAHYQKVYNLKRTINKLRARNVPEKVTFVERK